MAGRSKQKLVTRGMLNVQGVNVYDDNKESKAFALSRGQSTKYVKKKEKCC